MTIDILSNDEITKEVFLRARLIKTQNDIRNTQDEIDDCARALGEPWHNAEVRGKAMAYRVALLRSLDRYIKYGELLKQILSEMALEVH